MIHEINKLILCLVLSFKVASYRIPAVSFGAPDSTTPLSAVLGTKGRFHFLPVVQAEPDEYLPRIIPVAGVYSDLTVERLANPLPVEYGQDNNGFDYYFGEESFGAVAVPGSAVLSGAVDPVAVIANSDEVGVSSRRPVEVVMVVDRGQTTFCPDSFFLCRLLGQSSTLTLQRTDIPTTGAVLLAKVLLCFLPPRERSGADGGGFLESDDYF